MKKSLLYAVYVPQEKEEDKLVLNYTYDSISQPIAFFLFFVFKSMKAMSRAKPIDLASIKDDKSERSKKKKKKGKKTQRKMTFFNMDAVEGINKKKSKKAIT